MSIQNYFEHDIIVYSSTNTGTLIQPVYTWAVKSTFKGNKQVVSGNEVRTNTNTEIRADLILFCNVSDIMGYADRILLDDGCIYSVVFVEIPFRTNHAEILLKRMPNSTAATMGI